MAANSYYGILPSELNREHSGNSRDFAASQEAQFRRHVRNAIKRGPFTKTERDIALAFFNHWLHHRKNVKGVVHPGRKKIAKKAKCSEKAVTRLLAILRDNKVICAEAHLEGLHGNATEYSVDAIRLFEFCQLGRDEITVNGGTKVPTCGVDEMSRRINNVVMFPSQEGKRHA